MWSTLMGIDIASWFDVAIAQLQAMGNRLSPSVYNHAHMGETPMTIMVRHG